MPHWMSSSKLSTETVVHITTKVVWSDFMPLLFEALSKVIILLRKKCFNLTMHQRDILRIVVALFFNFCQ